MPCVCTSDASPLEVRWKFRTMPQDSLDQFRDRKLGRCVARPLGLNIVMYLDICIFKKKKKVAWRDAVARRLHLGWPLRRTFPLKKNTSEFQNALSSQQEHWTRGSFDTSLEIVKRQVWGLREKLNDALLSPSNGLESLELDAFCFK